MVSETYYVDVCDGGEDKYRFGFNGMEKDNEVKGVGNSLDFGARMYDSRIGRFLSLDPLSAKFPSESNYTFAGNSPIYLIDVDGKYRVPAHLEADYRNNYPLIMKYLEKQVNIDVMNSTKILNAYSNIRGKDVSRYINFLTTWGTGPQIEFVEMPGWPVGDRGSAGYYDVDRDVIEMNSGYALYVEDILKSDANPMVKQVAFTRFYMTLLHETAHKVNYVDKVVDYSDDLNGVDMNEKRSLYEFTRSSEIGQDFERQVWGYEDGYNPDPSNPVNENSGKKGVKGIVSEKYREGVTEGVIKNAKKTEEGKNTLPTVPKP